MNDTDLYMPDTYRSLDIDGDINEAVMKHLLLFSLISLNTTLPIDAGNGIAALDIFDIGYENERRSEQFEGATSQFYPLLAFGDLNESGTFGRVSVSVADPDCLWIAFRPMYLGGLIAAYRGKPLTAMLSTLRLMCRERQPYNHLLDSLNILKGIAAAGVNEDGLSKGYASMVMDDDVELTLGNPVAKLGFTKRRTSLLGFAKRLPSHGKIVPTISDLVRAYRPKRVCFTGFSLGAGQALAAAVCLKRELQRKRMRGQPEIHVGQFAGTRVGNSDLQRLCIRELTSCFYVGVCSGNLKDTVSSMPLSARDWKHCGREILIDYTTGMMDFATLALEDDQPSMFRLVVGLICRELFLPTCSWRWLESFLKVHLPGELMITLVILWNIEKLGGRSLRIPCASYSISGTAAKYRLCPEPRCAIVETITGNRRRSRCESAVLLPPY